MQAVNKLAEIMARKENLPVGRKPKASANDLRRKEKECRKLQQELTMVIYIYFFFSKKILQSDFPIKNSTDILNHSK